MTSLRAIRLAGLRFIAMGALGIAVAYALLAAGIGVSALVLFASPAMITVGLAMAIAPVAPTDADADFGDWLQALPLGRRVGLYAIGAVGLGIGAILVLHVGGWTVEGVVNVVL